MARTTITQITDDLDGSKDAQEVTFSFRGIDYTIDLSKKNQAAFDKALKPYLEAAAKMPKRTSRSSGRRGQGGAVKNNGVDLVAVREWARANGIEVSDRGRVARSVLDQYTAEHG